MKALLYKEFKLAMHPICYVFLFTFPFMMLIPSYPLGIGFIYVLSSYPILFLGANKGQQSNDLLFSTLLPVRKKDIVLARIFTVIIMHLIFIGMMCALWPLANLIRSAVDTAANQAQGQNSDVNVGLSLDGFVSLIAFALVGLALADIIFFPIYYKHGKSIVMSTLFTIIGFIIYIGVTTLALPLAIPAYMDLFCNSGIGIQFAFLGGGLVVYVALHYLVYRISSKELERVDF